MKKILLQTGFWLSFSVSAIINLLLAAIIAAGILLPQYHQSAQAPLPLIFLTPVSLTFGLFSLACAWLLKRWFQSRHTLLASIVNLCLLPVFVLGTLIWMEI
jgi:hypothetical protein